MGFGTFLRGVGNQLRPFDKKTYSTTYQEEEKKRQQSSPAYQALQTAKPAAKSPTRTPTQQFNQSLNDNLLPSVRPKQPQPQRTINIANTLGAMQPKTAEQQRLTQIGDAYRAGRINIQQLRQAVEGVTLNKNLLRAEDVGLRKLDAGKFAGSGIIEDFANSPIKMTSGYEKFKKGDRTAGIGEMLTGVIEGPLGVLPGARLVGGVVKAGAKGFTKDAVTRAVGSGAAWGMTYGGAEAAANKTPILEGVATGGLVGMAGGGVLGALGAGIARKLVQAKTPQQVKRALPKVSNETAQVIAQTEDENLIRAALEVDPGIKLSDEATAQLSGAGVSKVEKGETPYGAEYQDGRIRVRDQDMARDDVVFHELGHHLWSTKLTPDEKAAFKNNKGAARAQAEKEGRLGELESEDFSDYVAKTLAGRANEVPTHLRPIVAKYAKRILQEAPQAAVQAVKSVSPKAVAGQTPGALPQVPKGAKPPEGELPVSALPEQALPEIKGQPVTPIEADIPPAAKPQLDKMAQQAGFSSMDEMLANSPKGDIGDVVPEQELDISQKVFEELPASIKKKIQRDQPLAAEDYAKLSQKTDKLGEAANQLSLAVLEDAPRVRLRVAQGAAKRTTPSGQSKSIIRGEQVVTEDLAKSIAKLAKEEPGKFSRMVETTTGRNSKEFRSLINVLNSIRKKTPKAADDLEDFVFRPILELDAQANQTIRGFKGQILAVRNQHGKISNHDKDVLAASLDGKLGKPNEAVGHIGKQADNPEAVIAYTSEMRHVYNQALDAVNEQRRQAGIELIPKREDYFPHMKELLKGEFFTQPLKAQDPDYIRRLSSSFGFAKQRTGELSKIEKDPFKVMDVYLAASERQIASAVPASRVDGIIKVLDDIGASTDNDIAGWTKWMRKIQADITGSNSVNNLVLRLQGRYAAGTIILNPGSTLKNFIQPVLTAGVTRGHAVQAAGSTTMAGLRLLKDKNIKKYLTIDGMESAYLESAFSAMDLSRLADKSIARRLGDNFSKTFYATQLGGQRFIVEAFYRLNVSRGIAKQQALKVAERQAETMLPSRAPGTLPQVMRGGTLSRAASLFQTEVLAQAEALIQAGSKGVFARNKKEVAANIAGLAMMGSLFNEAYEELFPGQRPAPDPVKWTIDAIDKGEEGDSVAAGAVEFGKSALGQLPFVGSYFSDVSRSPLSLPLLELGRSVSEDVSGLVTGEGGNAIRLGRNLAAFAGRGGKAIYRAGEGMFRFAQGGVPDGDGGQMFETPPTAGNFIRSLLGGAYNTKEANKFFNQSDEPAPGSLDEIVEQAKESGITWDDFVNSQSEDIKKVVLDGKGKVRSNKDLDAIAKAKPELKGVVERFKISRDAFNHFDNDPTVAEGVGQDSSSLLKLFGIDGQDGKLTKRGQEALLAGAPRPETVNITGRLNEEFAKLIPEDLGFKLNPSNGLALEYAKYEHKLLKDGVVTADGQVAKPVEFAEARQRLIKKVMGQHFGEPVERVFALTQKEIKNHLKAGNLTIDAVKQAFYMDDLEVILGAKESLKFSKKFRREFGLGSVADSKGYLKSSSGSGRSGSRGSGSSSKINPPTPDISNFLGQQRGGFSEMPKIRRKTFKTVEVPSAAPSAKRISIKSLTLPSKTPTFSNKSK